MSEKQKTAAARYLDKLPINEGHHGDCVGADQEFHDMCLERGYRIVIHPPKNSLHRAFCEPFDEIREERTYRYRNMQIAKETDALLAAPLSTDQNVPSGTWMTINYALKFCKPFTILVR